MTEPAQNYVPKDAADHFRSQAYKVWAVTLGVAALWIFAIAAAPLALENRWAAISSPIYGFFSYACHQLSDRSLHLAGHPLAVCTRCFGVYFGLLVGISIYPLWKRVEDVDPPARFWLFLSLIPIGVDWSLTVFGVWENTHLSRLVTGLLLGVACGTFIVPAVVEIKRNMSSRRAVAG